jgi:hypothetical protein
MTGVLKGKKHVKTEIQREKTLGGEVGRMQLQASHHQKLERAKEKLCSVSGKVCPLPTLYLNF